jgi:uncharacterized repeat protein (TIGR03803 family)
MTLYPLKAGGRRTYYPKFRSATGVSTPFIGWESIVSAGDESRTGDHCALALSACEDEIRRGFYPEPLLQASDGNFYGTAGGGAFMSGTIFQITPAGLVSPLYSFQGNPNPGGAPDGANPVSLIVGWRFLRSHCDWRCTEWRDGVQNLTSEGRTLRAPFTT